MEGERSHSPPYKRRRFDLSTDTWGDNERPHSSRSLSSMEDESSRLNPHQMRSGFSSNTRSENRRPHSSRRNYGSVASRGRGLRDKQGQSDPRRGQGRKEVTITCSLLNSWAEMENAGELVLLMSSKHQHLQTFLKEHTAKKDWLVPLLDAVNHAITAQHQKESIKHLLDSLCNSLLFEHVTNYLTEKQLSEVVWSEADDFFTSCIQILDEVLNKLPQFANIGIRTASSLLNAACCIKPINENKTLIEAIDVVLKKAKEVFLAENEKEMRHRGRFLTPSNLENPPDNFMDISVVPTDFDLREDSNPFLRCAKIEGGYEDINQYLDIQFRLLRQDFILPLKNGIVEFKKNGCKKYFSSSDLRFYFDVRICGTVCIEEINHILQFDISSFKQVSWEVSKRFMFGSLLCLSKDNFETVLFATVANHDVENLAKGIVVVTFKTGLDEVFNSTSRDVYIMAETTAFFESYCHVLEGLQEIMLTRLPLQDYIIHCKKEISPPRYLLPPDGARSLPVYDLKCLMKNKVESEVAVLTTVKWPKADEMCLNESQRAAVQLALTKELAIIQGPPGTGKTYVGLKVMQVLLENTEAISRNCESRFDPILVVCYTNHALDQFLEGVLKFCPEGIVRVGGQCKSEILKKLNLTKLKRLHSSTHVMDSVEKCKIDCLQISDEIKELNKQMESLQTDIISDEILKQHMQVMHYDSFLSKRAQSTKCKPINEWLQISSDTAEYMIPSMIKQHLTMLVLKFKNIYGDTKLSENMNIVKRASFYHYYLQKYEHMLKNLKLQAGQQKNVSNKIIDDLLRAAQTRILPDNELDKVLFPGALRKINFFLRSDNMDMFMYAGDLVKYWLLGMGRDLQSQLDDIEILTKLAKQVKGDKRTFYHDHGFRQVQNDRMVDVDNSYAGKLNEKLRAALNNLAYVKQRADALGVTDNILIENEEKWETIKAKPLSSKTVQEKRLIEPMTEENESQIKNVWDLKLDERFALYNLWVKKYKLTLTEKMQELIKRYKRVLQRKKEASSEETLLCLKRSKVIGMTTTGAAKHRAVLQAVGCRIIIVEEAAEVLESHIVTSLNKNCKHLILIGDHLQLRPKPNVYQLAKDYGLEISLFERLLKNKVPHVMLKEQHRMSPEISKFMLHIYPDLEDHTSVEKYENIRGVGKNIFFIQHEHKELHMNEFKSKVNKHEAEYIVGLCQYLLNQDYKESQITILATYSGQVFEIQKAIKMLNLDISVTTVDNFQGEENDIILLSLVRSNTENAVGFLKVDNRVCVALSRAKMGFYVIGNFNLLASQSKLWKKIIETATLENVTGSSLPVFCQNHPDIKELVISDKDFEKCPEGGCGQPCNCKLQCGHTCDLSCHGYDPEHTMYKCMKPCLRKCHPCKLKCYQDCGDCTFLVLKHLPSCGHDAMVPCYIPETEAVCTQRCVEVLDCGHQCSGICGRCKPWWKHDICGVFVLKHLASCGHVDKVPCNIPETEIVCSQRCTKVLKCGHQCSGRCGHCEKCGKHDKCGVLVPNLLPCGHTDKVPCYTDLSCYPCPKVCGKQLECGHSCVGKCTECLSVAVHAACGEKCDKLLPCGHECRSFCGAPCLPCTESCPDQYYHTGCFEISPKPVCGHACEPCRKNCSCKCKHTKCSKLCYENCDIEPCKEECNKIVLSCIHKCSGICGELCVCRKCNKVLEISGKSEQSEAAEDDHSDGEIETDNELPVGTEKSEAPEDDCSDGEIETDNELPVGTEKSEAPEDDCSEGEIETDNELPVGTEKSEAPEDDCSEGEIESDNELSVRTDTTLKRKTTRIKIGTEKREDEIGLLIKIPTCHHIFYIDQLDKYVNDFDPDGSRYIQCPICQQPILKCARYEQINTERRRKRESEKETLRINTSISAEQLADLMMSKERLEKSSLLREFHSLPVTEVTNQVQVQVMSFQFKCAFLLNAIDLVMVNKYDSSSEQLLESRKTAVLRIKDRLTSQQKREFITELSRYFWLSYLSQLINLSLSDVPKEIDAEVNEITEALKKPNPSNETLAGAELVFDKKIRIMLEVLENSNSVLSLDSFQSLEYSPCSPSYGFSDLPNLSKAKLLSMEQTSKQAIKILKSRDSEMLCHLIEGTKDLATTSDDKWQETLDELYSDLRKETSLSETASPFGSRTTTQLPSQASIASPVAVKEEETD